MERPPALLALVGALQLSDFERDIVVLCLAAELDPRLRVDARPATMALALEALPGANWNALDAASPLRAWGIVDLERADALADSRLRMAPDVIALLMGFDPRRQPQIGFPVLTPPPVTIPRHRQIGESIARAVRHTYATTGEAPAIELYGAEGEDRTAVAYCAASALGASAAALDARDLPGAGDELEALMRTWSRCGS